jgi:hypothetical protein
LLDASEVCTELLPRFCNCISSCLKQVWFLNCYRFRIFSMLESFMYIFRRTSKWH